MGDEWLEWKVRLPEDVEYDMAITYAAPDTCKGNAYVLTAGNNQLAGQIEVTTKDWFDFTTVKLGRIRIGSGRQSISVKPVKLGEAPLMNLHEITLTQAHQ